jgi:CubicO group peptidase (beta-lactamase class C family)
MPVDALFRLYSMTKPIASVALLTLYEQGLFRLTDPLDRYLPQFANLKVHKGVDPSGTPILAEPSRRPTIQDAFRHTLGLASGLGQSPVDALYREAGLSMGRLDSLAQEMDALATVPLLFSVTLDVPALRSPAFGRELRLGRGGDDPLQRGSAGGTGPRHHGATDAQ